MTWFGYKQSRYGRKLCESKLTTTFPDPWSKLRGKNPKSKCKEWLMSSAPVKICRQFREFFRIDTSEGSLWCCTYCGKGTEWTGLCGSIHSIIWEVRRASLSYITTTCSSTRIDSLPCTGCLLINSMNYLALCLHSLKNNWTTTEKQFHPKSGLLLHWRKWYKQ